MTNPTPTRPEPTTPTREERIIERLCGAFDGLLKSWQRTTPGMTENEVLAMCRPSERDAYMLALWAKQHLTSEPPAPTPTAQQIAEQLRRLFYAPGMSGNADFFDTAGAWVLSLLQSAAVPASPVTPERLATVFGGMRRKFSEYSDLDIAKTIINHFGLGGDQ